MSESAGVVFVIDDDVPIRRAIGGLIRSIGLQVELFGSAGEFLQSKPPEVPGCVTLDIRLPGISGLDLQRRLTEARINTPIIFVTGQADIAMSVRAMKAGASDFFTKPFRDQELLDAIAIAVEQDRVRRRQEAEAMTLREHFNSLSSRERDIMNWVVCGLLNKQVAAAIGATEAAVKFHRAHLMRKMNATSLPDLVRMVVKLDSDEKDVWHWPWRGSGASSSKVSKLVSHDLSSRLAVAETFQPLKVKRPLASSD